MPLITQKWITRADLQANRDVLYIFGDNEERCGYGGQAGEMRGEPNAIGVATLAAPGRYWRADDTQRQCKVINQDLAPVRAALAKGNVVVFPEDGIGTGIASLKEHAPETFEFLERQIAGMRQPA